MSIVSNNIKYLRRLNGLTQEQFARRIGIKRSLLGAYEEARANPNLDNLMAIARAFNTTVDHLLKNDLRRLRETPDLSIPLDRLEPIGTAAPLPRELPEAPEPRQPELRQPEPKPLAAILDKFYHSPEPARMVEPAPEPRRGDLIPDYKSVTRGPVGPEPIRLVAQRIVPRPVSGRNSIPFVVTNYQAPPPPAFNNTYENSSAPAARPVAEDLHPQTSIQLVRLSQAGEYQQRYQHLDFLNRLPSFQMPLLPPGHYRAFETGDEFVFPGALLVGQFVRNWFEIADGKLYMLLIQHQGLVCRRVFNQVKLKGALLLASDQSAIPSREVPIRDVLEVWEVKAFMSQQLPEPPPSLDRVRSLVNELNFELERIK
ncbi:helix-turn-helix transcriptional regulator [Tellurirhabdus rosea]|uniref:helix-turn-helix transcriptional regulator n=1 Tax=Tellurirhabdus rosea TaxID=2674997 RepID=UPI0022591DF4|nr:helix-turn-helix domain-containing protein [Tellurirhabdus rosea]